MDQPITKPVLSLVNENSVRRKVLYFCFGGMLIVLIGDLFVSMFTLGFVNKVQNGEMITMDEANQIDMMIILSALFFLTFYVGCAVIFIMWMYRGYNNLEVSGRFRNMKFRPGWAIGSWFVPFMNLGRPVVVIVDYWQCIQKLAFVKTKEDLSKMRSMPIIGLWWGFYIAGGIVNNISNRVGRSETMDPLKNLYAQATTGIVAEILLIIATVFLFIMVWNIGKVEDEAFEKHNKQVEENEPVFGME